MVKQEQNLILDELWEGVNREDFKDEIKQILHTITKSQQLELMEKMMQATPMDSPGYNKLTKQCEKAFEDYYK